MLHFYGKPRRCVRAAPKAVLLQDIAGALTKIHSSLSSGVGKGGKIVLLLVCHSWEWERKWTWNSDNITADYGEPLGQVATVQHCPVIPLLHQHPQQAGMTDHDGSSVSDARTIRSCLGLPGTLAFLALES